MTTSATSSSTGTSSTGVSPSGVDRCRLTLRCNPKKKAEYDKEESANRNSERSGGDVFDLGKSLDAAKIAEEMQAVKRNGTKSVAMESLKMKCPTC